MEQITIKNLTFAYDTASGFSLNRVSLEVEQGEIFLVTGGSGCGKTTLLKHLKMEYMPQGVRSDESEIWIQGQRIEEMDEWEQARTIGFVGQNVDAFQVTDKVWHELAFGLENLGYEQDVMQRKVAEMTAFLGLEGIYHKKLCNLSGGQKQLVNLASVMAMEPDVLVLDEPTSQLDPIAATEFFRMIEKINRELGTTIIMTEHRLEEVFSMCHRVCVMDVGSVVAIDTPERIACALYDGNHLLAKALPAAAKLFLRLESERNQIPLTVNEGRRWLKHYMDKCDGTVCGEEVCRDEVCTMKARREKVCPDESCREKVCPKKVYLEEGCMKEVSQNEFFRKDMSEKNGNRVNEHTSLALVVDELWFRYEKDGNDILKACSLKLEQGKITAILGGNGAGKSTLLNVIAGHLTAYLGKVKKVSGRIGMLPQNPQAMFAKKTVEEELVSSLEKKESEGQSEEDRQCKKKNGYKLGNRLQKVIDFCDLQQILKQHPFDLSGGQMQKLALAKLLLEDKEILLLDEPGKGMDYAYKEEMGRLLKMLVSQGKTVLMVSHDVEFCAKYADVCGLFFDGAIVSLADNRNFFLQNTFYTTAVARMCRGILPQAVVMEDVLQALFFAEKENCSGPDGHYEKGSICEVETVWKEKNECREECAHEVETVWKEKSECREECAHEVETVWKEKSECREEHAHKVETVWKEKSECREARAHEVETVWKEKSECREARDHKIENDCEGMSECRAESSREVRNRCKAKDDSKARKGTDSEHESNNHITNRYKLKPHKTSRMITLSIIFIAMPLTIYIGQTVLLQRKYYFISLLLLIEAILCFFVRFEKRSPKLREMMVIAVMSAIVVAGRAAFYMVPNVKPMVALVILTGVGFGAEAGFLVGSMSMLVSNIFFGQGPWTPWQMFAMGILGFLAGVVFRQDTPCDKKKKYGICVFGFLSVVFIYGGIMNPGSVLMYQENVNLKMLISACVAGFPFDVMHGAATFTFLWIGSRPMLEKLQRVRVKYGMM